jgi:magnesium chelatase subunit D
MLPFPALIGLDAARQALLLLAVDPGLGGVVLAAGVGTGKSTLMRSFARFLGTTTFVELPVGVTEDRLLGGLDLEATLASGTRVHRSGLMAAADGGLLYADNVNLLDDSTTNHILAAFDSRMVRI